MENDPGGGLLPLQERQKLYLERQWALLEVLKKYNSKFPFLSAGTNLALVGFLLSFNLKGVSNVQVLLATNILGIFVIAILTGFSITFINSLHKQIAHRNRRINYLYSKMKIWHEDLVENATGSKPDSKEEDGFHIFTYANHVIGITGVVSIIAILVIIYMKTT
ncbi:MAG: hypothetical protein OEZ58_00120 [Gammaproteobacteria bacterium]|nr:hypothetical protein [Gammaproteobacteria bacterium]